MNTFAAVFAALLPLQPLPPVDNGLMTNVPGYGPSRIETVDFCVKQAGVDRYQDLLSDYEFETFHGCLEENT